MSKAALAAAPAQPDAAAPSAPPPTTMEQFQELARLSLLGETKPAEAVAPAAPEAGKESPPAEGAAGTPTAEEQAAAEAAAAEAAAAGEQPPTEKPPAETEVEPTAEDIAAYPRIYGALQKEREARKAANAAVAEIKAQLAELRQQIKPTPADPGQAPSAEPKPATTPQAAAPSATPALAECHTFEAVDHAVQAAVETETTVVGLQQQLARDGAPAVAETLKKLGITAIKGVPVAEQTDETLGDFLHSVYTGCRHTQAQAAPRRATIQAQQQAFGQAMAVMPEIANPASEQFKAMKALIDGNPALKAHPQAPLIAAKLMLGEQAFQAQAKAKLAAVRPAVTPRPAPPKPAPGAPKNAVAALPPRTAGEDISAKIENGTATMEEMLAHTRASLRVG